MAKSNPMREVLERMAAAMTSYEEAPKPRAQTKPAHHLQNEGSAMDAIKYMLRRANDDLLMVEVINSFGEFRAEGQGVVAAAHNALYTWELLE